jgi:DNA processing protein
MADLFFAESARVAAGSDDIDRLRLARTHRIGPVTYRQLIARFGSAGAALDALPDLVRRNGGKSFTPATHAMAEREIANVAALGARHLFIGAGDYPSLLTQLGNAPVALIVRGDASLLARPAIAIVGARNASAAACRFARQLAGELGAGGYVVVSGLARGIDTAAHIGAMTHGTVGVIASGIDISFPPENAALQAAIGDRHLLMTEYPPGTEPLARQFPHRNRIIAGSALGTVVVEAAPKSGSLLTAKMAGEAGREVMAVPGSPLDPRSHGCNGLIREGATLIQSAADIAEAVGSIDRRMVRSPQHPFDFVPQAEPDDAERATLVSLLGPVATGIDELIRQSGLSAQAVQLVLLDFELAGRIERHAAGRVSLIF